VVGSLHTKLIVPLAGQASFVTCGIHFSCGHISIQSEEKSSAQRTSYSADTPGGCWKQNQHSNGEMPLERQLTTDDATTESYTNTACEATRRVGAV